jgi:RNA polymerase sigma-70 factor (ECF subfamily)
MDTFAFDAAYESLFSDLRRVCRALGAGHDAEDIAQESILEGRRRLVELRDDSRVLPWLRRIAVRATWRGRKGGEKQAAKLSHLSTAGPVDGFDGLDLAIDQRNALARLTIRQREMVALVYVAGYRQDEVAEMLGVTRGTVARTLWDARRHLAEQLAAYRKEAGR